MKIKLLILCGIAGMASTGWGCDETGVTGLTEDNDAYLPLGMSEEGNVSEEAFHFIPRTIIDLYENEITELGGVMTVRGHWESGTVNAYASQEGNAWYIDMYGGLARHETIYEDSYALVVCHELGHHIGGAPKKGFTRWASNEGQSDYFANLKCIRRYFKHLGNSLEVVKEMQIDPYVQFACRLEFLQEEDIAICERGSMAGMSLANLFKVLRNQDTPISFETPDPAEVSSTYDYHPATQCRLDTYFDGSICSESESGQVSQEDPNVSVCRRGVHRQGPRPRCWYAPGAGIFNSPLTQIGITN